MNIEKIRREYVSVWYKYLNQYNGIMKILLRESGEIKSGNKCVIRTLNIKSFFLNGKLFHRGS